MMKHTTWKTILGATLMAILLTQPALACMDHEETEWYPETEVEYEPVVVEPAPTDIECSRDLECPSAMLCEPVVCCMAEDCVCPVGLCAAAPEGAQGRECEADRDCGDGFECTSDDIETCGAENVDCAAPLGWCEALPETLVPEGQDLRIDEAFGDLQGCQGGTDHGLPLSLALFILLTLAMRRRQTA